MLNPRARAPAPHRSSPAALVLVPLAFACVLAGCNEETDYATLTDIDCPVRVLVRHAAEPDSALLTDLERTNALELEPVGTITNELRVYRLRAAGGDDDCTAAIERLRRDQRVRSVDLDARRAPHVEQ